MAQAKRLVKVAALAKAEKLANAEEPAKASGVGGKSR
jgi:hypothetical protein